MIKINKCRPFADLTIQSDGRTGTVTKGKVYFIRHSKKGNLVVKSNEGQWLSLSAKNREDHRFESLGELFFRNRKELWLLSI